MAFEPQRFIHAANIRLDVPVSVQVSDVLTDELRTAFEDATLQSFESVIDACLRHRVDYLLLSGNVFIEADRSLRARLALLTGVRRLESKGIRVFVLPGDADPPEAWRAIPELPSNVHICFSSNPEPVELIRDNHVAATVSASMWYGETDAFGIRVIAEDQDGIQPFRIGLISQAKFEETQRMAAMTAGASEDLLNATLQNSSRADFADDRISVPHGTLVSLSDPPDRRKRRSLAELDPDDEQSLILPGVPPEGGHSGDHGEDDTADDESSREWDPAFLSYVDELLRECRLNYVALTGELQRTRLKRPLGYLHCPGTTQPRSHSESAMGACSLVEVAADGSVSISAVDTSSIDWKDIEIKVESGTTLSSMLQEMKSRLLDETVGAADRIWSVHWTLRCSMPVLQELVHDELAVAVAVELDELESSGRRISLLHNVQMVPESWTLADPHDLAQRYSDIVNERSRIEPTALTKLLEEDRELTTGWRQRLSSLIPGLDEEQLLARMRIDGAGWFIPDLSVLVSDDASLQDKDLNSDGESRRSEDGKDLQQTGPKLEEEATESVYADDEDPEFDEQDDVEGTEISKNSLGTDARSGDAAARIDGPQETD